MREGGGRERGREEGREGGRKGEREGGRERGREEGSERGGGVNDNTRNNKCASIGVCIGSYKVHPRTVHACPSPMYVQCCILTVHSAKL